MVVRHLDNTLLDISFGVVDHHILCDIPVALPRRPNSANPSSDYLHNRSLQTTLSEMEYITQLFCEYWNIFYMMLNAETNSYLQ